MHETFVLWSGKNVRTNVCTMLFCHAQSRVRCRIYPFPVSIGSICPGGRNPCSRSCKHCLALRSSIFSIPQTHSATGAVIPWQGKPLCCQTWGLQSTGTPLLPGRSKGLPSCETMWYVFSMIPILLAFLSRIARCLSRLDMPLSSMTFYTSIPSPWNRTISGVRLPIPRSNCPFICICNMQKTAL